ncbi:MAG: hypothetical protein AAFP18_00010 [Bacteroidota bacterium]
MSLTSFPANVSTLKSRAIPAVQSRSLVVAVVRLHPAQRHGWAATLAVGEVGGVCRPVARVSVSGRTRAQARNSAVELARRYARALSELPASSWPAPLPPGPGLVREASASYGRPVASEPLEHVEIECLPGGGFLLTLIGAGFDGTCVHVVPQEAALWSIVERLSALCGVAPSSEQGTEEARLHEALVCLLLARTVPTAVTQKAA